MKYILFILMFVSLPALGKLNQCEYRKQFSTEQWETVRAVWYASYPTNFKYTVAAVAINESSAGKFLVNHKTKDYGIFQINIKTAMKRLKRWVDNGRDFSPYDVTKENDVKDMLISDYESIGVSLALEELGYWYNQRNGQWKHVWASYNGGYFVKTEREKRAMKYSQKIHKTVNQLKTCYVDLLRG